MAGKIRVGVLGATGMVGQNFVKLLSDHPWFELVHLAASATSAGKKYSDAVAGRWHVKGEIPHEFRDVVVEDASNIEKAIGKCDLVFSAVEMDKQAITAMEAEYANKGFAVVSNNSAPRAESATRRPLRWNSSVP